MKFILSLLLVVLTLSVATLPTYADNSTNQVQSASPSAAQLVDKFGTRLDEMLTTLASKAGVAADHFYPIFVTQQRIVGIVDIVAMIGLFVGALLALRYAVKNASIYNSSDYHSKEKDKSEPRMITGYIAGAILSIVFIIFTLTQITDSIGQTFNPEYYAVQALVHMVK